MRPGKAFDEGSREASPSAALEGRIRLLEEQLKREREARRREGRLADVILNTAHVVVLLLDQDGKIVTVSRFFEQLTGWTQTELVGEDWFAKCLPARLSEDIRRRFKGRLEGPSSPHAHSVSPVLARDGTERLIEWHSAFARDGKDGTVLAVGIDVSGRSSAEKDRDDGAVMLREIMEHLGPVFFLRDFATRKMLYVNPAYERLWGRRVADIMERPSDFVEPIHPEDKPRVLAALELSNRREKWFDEEYRIVRPDGSVRFIHAQNFPVPDSTGQPYRLAGFAEDVTPRRRVEESRKEAETVLKELGESISEVLFLHDSKTEKFIYVNAASRVLLGLDPAVVVEDADELLRLLDSNEYEGAPMTEYLRTGKPFQAERKVKGPSDGIRWLKIRGFPVKDADGSLIRFAGVIEDFSKRRAEADRLEAQRAELERLVEERTAALIDASRLFEALANQSPAGVFRMDLEGRLTFVNPRYLEITGLDREGALGWNWVQSLLPAERQCVLAYWRKGLEERRSPLTTEIRLYLPSGEERLASVQAQLEVDGVGNPRGYIGTVTDVTEQNRLRDLLLKTERLAGLGSWDLDLSKQTLRLSPDAYQLHGLTPDERNILGLQDLLAAVDPVDRPSVEAGIRLALQTGHARLERFRPVFPSGAGRVLAGEAEAEFDPKGKPVRLRGFVQDVTDRTAMENALVHSIEEKSVLLKEIHHRVKNSLQIVASLLYLQARRIGDPTARAMLQESRDRLLSMALIHEMLYQSKDSSRVELEAYLDRLIHGLRLVYDHADRETKIDLVCLRGPVEAGVAIPCGLIINELVTNAFKYACGGPNVRIHVAFSEHESGYVLRIGDDGPGLPPDVDPHTAETLGFTIVRTLVEQLDGTMEVERERKGLAFVIRFPRASGEDSGA